MCSSALSPHAPGAPPPHAANSGMLQPAIPHPRFITYLARKLAAVAHTREAKTREAAPYRMVLVRPNLKSSAAAATTPDRAGPLFFRSRHRKRSEAAGAGGNQGRYEESHQCRPPIMLQPALKVHHNAPALPTKGTATGACWAMLNSRHGSYCNTATLLLGLKLRNRPC